MTLTTSIVIPAYNESLRLAAGFERLAPVLDEMGLDDIEVIIVDDGSSDDTLHTAHAVYGHLPHTLFVQQPKNMGKGAAVRLGISVARAPYVIATDADLSIRPVHFPDIVVALHTSALAPGSREHEGKTGYDSVQPTGPPLHRHHASRYPMWLQRLPTRTGSDTFAARFLRPIHLRRRNALSRRPTGPFDHTHRRDLGRHRGVVRARRSRLHSDDPRPALVQPHPLRKPCR
jgi:glycosyltransferase involved in cell wall biosynthesis